MAYEPHMIAPFENSGLKKWYKPWLTGEQAFPQLSDAYARRGVVRKREGIGLLGTLPTLPVQGLKTFVNPATLNESLIAFSRTKSYFFNDSTQLFVDNTQYNSAATTFSFGNGDNDYFWSCNYAGAMWICNGLGYTDASAVGAAKGIFYLTSPAINSWSINQGQVSGGGTPLYLNGALILIPYKGRLVALNTIEGQSDGTGNTSFSNRARWSQIGTPYTSKTFNGLTPAPPAPFTTDVNAWRSDIPGKGGFVDADTSERIVSASVVKDTLIVFFQRSTWRLRYTGSEILPFIWERLNTQYGSESPYSVVSFDEAALAFSRYGWIASSTNDVARIDLEIPDDSFSIEGVNLSFKGLNKVQGIRDFYRNFAYFTFVGEGSTFANQIYAYNYIDKSWTIYNPQLGANNGINCFGSYHQSSGDVTWASMTKHWYEYSSPDEVWSSFAAGEELDFPYIVGGDLLGNVYTMFEFFQVPPTSDNGTNFNFQIWTKRFNPYIKEGHKCRLGYIDLYCTRLTGGEITVNHYVDDNTDTPIYSKKVEIFSRGVINITAISVGVTTTITTATNHNLVVNETITLSDIVGSVGSVLNNGTFVVTATGTATTFTIAQDTNGYVYSSAGFVYNGITNNQDAFYTRVFLGAIAHTHQLEFTLSSDQLSDPVKGVAQFELQGVVLWTRPTGRIRG